MSKTLSYLIILLVLGLSPARGQTLQQSVAFIYGNGEVDPSKMQQIDAVTVFVPAIPLGNFFGYNDRGTSRPTFAKMIDRDNCVFEFRGDDQSIPTLRPGQDFVKSQTIYFNKVIDIKNGELSDLYESQQLMAGWSTFKLTGEENVVCNDSVVKRLVCGKSFEFGVRPANVERVANAFHYIYGQVQRPNEKTSNSFCTMATRKNAF